MSQSNHLRVINANLFTPRGTAAAKGCAMSNIEHIPNAVIDCVDGCFASVTEPRNAPALPEGARVIDAHGCAVLPGFVDSHTHAVFGGYRPDEFAWRMRGDSYMSIMERGGGIVSTVDATRAASFHQLRAKTLHFVADMVRMGITTVEMKSGYGLDFDTELRMLEVIKSLADDPDTHLDIVATYLGAHAVPREMASTPDKYIDLMINQVIPEVANRRLARFCDVFCEKGVFSVEQSRLILEAGLANGLLPKLHADEIVCTDGAVLAAEMGALSADHLLHISRRGIDALAVSHTVATLLPLTAFTLREPYAPARDLIDSGAAVALATDFNPGSCMSGSIPLMAALACIHMGMSVEETVTALTLNGAAALGLADRKGSVEPGKHADMVILQFPSPQFLPYFTGRNCVATTIHRGRVVYSQPY